MGEEIKSLYIKRTQRDYSLFKLSVVREIEQGIDPFEAHYASMASKVTVQF